jgi:hypothetical protein
MDASERSEFVKGYTKVLTNAWSDEGFKSQLKSNPKGVLAEYGLDVPADANVEIVPAQSGEGSLDDQVEIWEKGAETGTYRLYVPEVPQVEAGELSEAELDAVSGAGDVTVCCCCSPCCTCT